MALVTQCIVSLYIYIHYASSDRRGQYLHQTGGAEVAIKGGFSCVSFSWPARPFWERPVVWHMPRPRPQIRASWLRRMAPVRLRTTTTTPGAQQTRRPEAPLQVLL